MKRLAASMLALALTTTAATASAQVSSYPSYSGGDGYYDYARVLRVDPVYDSRYGGRYAASTGTARCVEDRTYAGGYEDRYRRDDGYYRNDGYARDDGYYRDGYRDRPTYGSNAGATTATVIGGIVGAVVGSKVGGGSARYATSALGSMVGGMAGRQIYEQTQRNRAANHRVGVARACDPIPVGAYESGRGASMYDVTYEYGGRSYTTRTSYDPGDRIRVRVDVRPE
jgi:uncharacterized protein YcfJ